MKIISSNTFSGKRAWEALEIASFEGTSVRLHWTDRPYHWHTNEGQEVFAVMQGCVEMFYRVAGQEKSVMLNVGDIFYASEGTEHVAHPHGEARVLVIEKQGSV